MKVCKLKDNQILLEDESFKNLKDSDLQVVESKTGLSDSEYNNIYESLILAYRTPGMDASKQIYVGDRLSLLTTISSMLQQMIDHDILSFNLLYEIVDMIKKVHDETK